MARLIRPVGLIVIAIAVGFVVARAARSGHHHDSDALTRTASSAAFAVRYPADWRATDPAALPGLTLRDQVAVGPTGTPSERLVIGSARATTVGALPSALLASLASRPHPETVALGAHRFDRYLNLRPTGASGPVSIYLLATNRSTITATCTAPTSAGSFVGQCERVLATLALPAGTLPSNTVDAAYALGLNGILAALDRVRTAAGPGLLASALTTRAHAAEQLARGEAVAAQAAGRLSAGSATAANRSLTGALSQAAAGYRALATAALKHDPDAYVMAQQTLERAQATLTTAFKTLASLGYQLR